MISRRHRNRRLGDFLKELGLKEGRSTGSPTIQEELVKNGSSRAIIETNDDRNYINVFIPVHEGCGDIVELNDTINDTINDTKELSDRQIFIINLIKQDETITIPQLTLKTSVSRSTILRELNVLQTKGVLIRIGSRKNGRWIINPNNTHI